MTNDRTEPTPTQVLAMLDRAQALARRAMDAGHHPFGALLVDADHATVLMEQGNVDRRCSRATRRGATRPPSSGRARW